MKVLMNRVSWAAVGLFVLATMNLSVECDAANTTSNLRNSVHINKAVGKTTPATPFWIGNLIGEPRDTACYRRTYISSSVDLCPRGYDHDGVAACWAQCPLEYPVECGMECIPQNQACSKEVLRKVMSVVTAAMNAATAGVFGQLVKASKVVATGVNCVHKLQPVVEHIVDFVGKQGKVDDSSTKAQLKEALVENKFITQNLPIAVSVCLGFDSLAATTKAAKIANTVLDKALEAIANNEKLSDKKTFAKFLISVGFDFATGNKRQLLHSAIEGTSSSLTSLEIGMACGKDMKKVIDRIVHFVTTLKEQDKSSTIESIRFAVMNSDLFLRDLPETAVKCVDINSPDALETRDQILSTTHAVVDNVLGAANTSGGKALSASDYAVSIADMGLDAIAMFDPIGLADLAKVFTQPICGPTIFTKAIDTGAAEDALGLRMVEGAFASSMGKWETAAANPTKNFTTITFESRDTKEVTVMIMSGGNALDSVKIPAMAGVVEWKKPLTVLQGKTLYMVRSRPGFLGFKGKAGGSLLVWVPDVAGKGTESLTLDVKINPPSKAELQAQAEAEAMEDPNTPSTGGQMNSTNVSPGITRTIPTSKQIIPNSA